jgi:hypothetical protein
MADNQRSTVVGIGRKASWEILPPPALAVSAAVPPPQLSNDEVVAIFSPDVPPMSAIKLVWDNPEKLDLEKMRQCLRELARILRAKPLNDGIDVMIAAVDVAIEQLDKDPAGLTLDQAMSLKAAAEDLRRLLAGGSPYANNNG